MADAPKFIARRVGLTIAANAIHCKMSKVSLLPEEDEIDTPDFCDAGGVEYGEPTWTLGIDVYQSFGDGASLEGVYDTLSPLSLTRVPFVLMTDRDIVVPTPAAPHFTFTALVPTIPIIDAEPGKPSSFPLSFPVQGQPLMLDGS